MTTGLVQFRVFHSLTKSGYNMRFLLISNLFPPHIRGGYELGCLSVAEYLQAQGHEVRVLTSKAIGQLRKKEVIHSISVKDIFLPIYGYEDLVCLREDPVTRDKLNEAFGGIVPANCIALEEQLEIFAPDVVWIFNPLGLGPIGIMETVLAHGARALIHLMDDIDGVIQDYQNHEGTLLPRFASIKRFFGAIACSEKVLLANSKIGEYGRGEIIYNGVDFTPNTASPILLPAYPKDKVKLVYFGQIEEPKGLLQLVEGTAYLVKKRRIRRFSIDLYGQGSSAFAIKLKAAIQKHDLENHIYLKDWIDQKQLNQALSQYHAAIMLLSPKEPFGYAVMEAFVSNLPVIVTKGGGFSEVTPENYPLFVDDRDNAADVAAKMEICITKLPAIYAMMDGFKQHLKEHCDFETITAPRYLKFINQIPPAKDSHSKAQFSLEEMLAAYYTSQFARLAMP